MTKKQLEEKYGVRIERDDMFLIDSYEYRIYSADGCPWDKGFKTLKSVERECKEWAKELIAIKEDVEKRRKRV